MAVSFTLPYPPSANHYWKTRIITPRGRKPFPQFYISPAGKQYRRDVEAAIVEQFGPLKPTAARLKVTILAIMPDRRVRDLSNILKATEDALTAALVWQDDNQIDDLRVVRGRVEKPGWLEVDLEKLTDG
jgi:crossover junction endodeoxyribonuclease RusA